MILLGVAVGVSWAGLRLYSHLKIQEARATQPSPSVSTHAGTLAQRRLYDILIETNSSSQEAVLIAKTLSGAINIKRLSPEDRYSIAYSSSGKFLHLTLIGGLKRYIVAPDPAGKFRASTHEIPLITTQRRAAGAISDNLWRSMESQGVPAGVILQFANIFQWTVDFLTQVRKADRFTVVWTERRTADGRAWDQTVRAASFDGASAGNRRAILFKGKYFDEKGRSLKRMFLSAPLHFSRISSGFSKRRWHPILRIARPHHGIDYAAAPGTPVSSVADGVIAAARHERAFGNVVKIRHNAGYTTLYAHLSRFAPGIRSGLKVRQGQVIGNVGSSGLATGPHLHFQIEKNGRWADFLKLDLPFASSVPAAWRFVFARERDRVLANLDSHERLKHYP